VLWPVIKPPESGLYWLDEVHKFFYLKLFEGYPFEDCFPENFKSVLDASGKTNEYFQAVYDSYLGLDAEHQNSYCAIYNQQVNLLPTFSDERINILRPNIRGRNTSEHKAIWAASKKLGGYLYSTTLGLVCFDNALNTNFGTNLLLSTMNDHYQAYKVLNGGVCCFCGLENMTAEVLVEPDEGSQLEEEKQRRASYDHYLPKAHYPFLAVDFNNLIPCCDVCNEDFKEEKDMLVNEGRRELAFTPYEQEVCKLKGKYAVNSSGFYQMQVSIDGAICNVGKKTNTWSRVFRVIERANHMLKNEFITLWVAPMLCDYDSARLAQCRLQREHLVLQPDIKNHREVYFKSLCFNTLSNAHDNEIIDLISTVKEYYDSRLGKL